MTERPADGPGLRGPFGQWWHSIPRKDRHVITLAVVGAELAAAAVLGLLFRAEAATGVVAVSAVGVGMTLVALWLGRKADPLPPTKLMPSPGDGEAGRPDRGWTQHKVFAFIVQAQALLGLAALALIPLWGIDARVHLWFAFGLLALVPVSLFHTLTYRLQRGEDGPSPARRALGVGFLGAGGVTAVAAVAMAATASLFESVAPTLLATTVLAALGYHLLHRPPTPRDAFLDDAVLWPGRPGLTFPHTVGVPAAVAASVAAAVLAVALFLHVGASVMTDIRLLALLASLTVVTVGGALLAVMYNLSPDEPDRWLVRSSASATTTRMVVGSAGTFAVLLLIVAVLIALGRGPLAPTRWIDSVALAVLVATGPYGFLVAQRARHVRRLEERFPDFLRDLASGRKAGLTLEASVKMATRGDYGALTPEVRRMAAQLSWNLSFEEALERFSQRVRTPLVARAVSLIIEASRSGGHVAAVLQAAAEDARHRKDVQDTRRSHMAVYTGIVYIGFFVFLGVAAVLYATLVPRLVEVSASVSGSDAPQVTGLTVTEGVRLSDYRTFYFVAALAQAVGNGIFAGLVSTGRVFAGLQHVFFMAATTALVFLAFGAP